MARRHGADQHAAARRAARAGRHAGHRASMEPIIAKAARKLGIDQVAIRRINAPAGKAPFGPRRTRAASAAYATSAFVKEALDKGAELFEWDERKARSGKRSGTKVRGIGVAVSPFVGRLDRLRRPVRHQAGRPRCTIQSGIGNLGTALGVRRAPRRRRDARRAVGASATSSGATPAKNLPWTCVSGGSQTTHAMTRAAHAAATDAIKKLQEIAAKTLGGNPESYKVAGGTRLGPRRQHDARAGGAEGDRARRQVRRPRTAGGHQRLHEDVGDGARRPGADGRGAATPTRATASRSRTSPASPKSKSTSRPASYQVLDYVAVADVGTVINPRSLGGQMLGGIDARPRPRA